MKIEDTVELRTFDTMPTETTLFMSAVRWDSGTWYGGPCGDTKDAVVRSLLDSYKHVTEARIYSVKLPIRLHSAKGGKVD